MKRQGGSRGIGGSLLCQMIQTGEGKGGLNLDCPQSLKKRSAVLGAGQRHSRRTSFLGVWALQD